MNKILYLYLLTYISKLLACCELQMVFWELQHWNNGIGIKRLKLRLKS